MIDRFIEFFALCRKNGLRISTAESLDALAAVERVGLKDVRTVRGALQATLVKRAVEEPIFDELFDLFFFRRSEFVAQHGALVDRLAVEGLTEEELEHLLALLADEAARLSPLARMGLGFGGQNLQSLMQLMGVRVDFDRLQNPLQIGFFTQQVLDGMRVQDAQTELRQLRDRLATKVGEERAGQIVQKALGQLDQLRSSVRTFVTEEFERRNLRFTEQMRKDLLAQKPFVAMSETELARLRREVTRLACKLREKVSMRKKVVRRGRLDIRRTMRASLSSGGVPFRLVYRRRKRERPRLVVLCDISDSVRHVSRFMLQFAYTLQELFSKVRSFVFVSDLGEATELFKQHEIQRAVDLAYSGAVVNVYANSNFGRAFRMFAREHLESVTPRTTVLIIGDGRNNYNAPESWALAAIAERAKRVLWLNPESPASWGFGDSVMQQYAPHCDRVSVVQNLASLARVVDELVL